MTRHEHRMKNYKDSLERNVEGVKRMAEEFSDMLDFINEKGLYAEYAVYRLNKEGYGNEPR